MAIKVVVYAIGVSVAMLGCASEPMKLSEQQCSSSPCGVPVKVKFLGLVYDLPDKIVVTAARPMTISWVLDPSVPSRIYFNPARPIEFKPEYVQYFDCSFEPNEPNPNEPRTYKCINNAPPGGPYKYTIKTKGNFSPPDLDPRAATVEEVDRPPERRCPASPRRPQIPSAALPAVATGARPTTG